MDNKKTRLACELNELINRKFSGPVADRYRERLEQGRLTIDENPESHFCVYFAAFDPQAREVFIGHHKKSGLWLFNGGHIDSGETIFETLKREIEEEWGLDPSSLPILPEEELITITPIENPAKQTCREHYDIWFFIPVRKREFNPKPENLLKEYYGIGWKKLVEARAMVTDKSTLEGIRFIERYLFKINSK